MSQDAEGPDAGERRAHNGSDDLSKIGNVYTAPEDAGLERLAKLAANIRAAHSQVELVGAIIDRDAMEIGELYGKARTSFIHSVRYQIECGERLIAKRASLSRGAWLPWLEANAGWLGFESPRTPQRLMKVAANATLTSHLNESEAIKISRVIWGNNTVRGTTGSGENEWYTPDEHLEAVRDVLGNIDVDPATSKAAQEKVNAATFFTKHDDGLRHEWHGRVWLNPPYAQPAIASFVSKMVAERRAGRVSSAIMLTHNYTDTAWFHEAASAANAICFTRGRVKFHQPNGEIAAPTQGQAFFYFGDESLKFAARFGNIGFVLMPTGGSYCETFQRQALSGWGANGEQAPATLPREDADDLEIPSFLRRASA